MKTTLNKCMLIKTYKSPKGTQFMSWLVDGTELKLISMDVDCSNIPLMTLGDCELEWTVQQWKDKTGSYTNQVMIVTGLKFKPVQ